MLRRRACGAASCAAASVRRYTDARTLRTPAPYDQFLAAENQTYVEDMLRQYEADSALVDRSWVPVLEAMRSGPAGAPVVATFCRPIDSTALSEKQRLDNMRLSWMISEYEHNGHYLAATNPLPSPPAERHRVSVDLGIAAFGFTRDDLSQVFNVSFGANYEATFVSGGKAMTLQQIVAQLQQMYCGAIGYEFMSCGYFDLRNWFRQEILAALRPLSTEDKRAIYDDVVKACEFERFLHLKYATAQRFGLDGGEAFIAAVNAALAVAAGGGAQSCIVGMAHRGRLNFLANVCRKSLYAIFSEFEGKVAVDSAHLDGDVKYHLGLCQQVTTRGGRPIEMDLLPNPSHLEAVNAVVLGKARARQARAHDVEGTSVLPILVHGDASFAGQGSCYETMGLSDLSHFTVGGTLHIVINNQVGFTTNPTDTQAGVYCTALSRVNHAPVLHVNGDDVEACVRAARIAARFRQQFHRDIIVDIVCYRRNGHNESDVPDFTQPQLYAHIRQHPTLIDRYTATLVAEGVLAASEAQSMRQDWQTLLRQSYERMQTLQDYVPVRPVFDPESENTAAEFEARKMAAVRVQPPPPAIDSGVDVAVLRRVGLQLTTLPHDMTRPHPVVERTYAARKKAIESGDGLEWCLAELLALGTLSLEGVPVRLTGEDVERGTFTQRHAGITDMRTNLKYFPVATLSPSQAPVTICNSSLSEFGVCAFELGYNSENTKALTMWEAQFGDFANGAQVVFDQFLCCGEDKWNTPNSLVLSLPHGYSGAGPEHSSGRIERFLQLSNDVDHVPSNFRGGAGATATASGLSAPRQLLELRIRKYNMQVAYPSTPASYFHLLRRQALRDFAKPLVIFFSKARLRAPNVSSLDELARGTAFAPVLCADDVKYDDTDTAHHHRSSGGRGHHTSSQESVGVGANKGSDDHHDDNNDGSRRRGATRLVPRRLLFCTGQIESIVRDARTAMQASEPGLHDDVVLVTLEQLSPFPWEQVAAVLERYARRNPAVHIAWLQEEPKNMGAWAYMRPRFNSLLRHLSATATSSSSLQQQQPPPSHAAAAPQQHSIDYIGRPAAASPSTGYGSVHVAEEQAIIAQCFA